jgi:hypothetical protein
MNASPPSVHTADEIVAAKHVADEQYNEAVEIGFQRAIVEAELDDGEGNLDKELVAEKVYEILRTKRVAEIGTEKDDRYDPATSSTKDELTVAIFTAGPTTADAEKNDVVKKVYEKCQAAVWNLTTPSGRGLVQRHLEADKLLLVRGKVFRNGNPITNGIYVSTHEEIVLREFMGPRLEKLRKLTEAIEEDFMMATARSKDLEAPLRAAIEAAMREASAKLPVPALGGGASNGQKTLDK